MHPGVFILAYLARNPPPPGARFAHDFGVWAKRLTTRGRERTDGLGVRTLRATEDRRDSVARPCGTVPQPPHERETRWQALTLS